MDAMDLLETRRSIRKFQKGQVPREDLVRMIEIAKMAPNGHNSQPWFFSIVDRKEDINALGAVVQNKVRGLASQSERFGGRLIRGIEKMTFFRFAPALILAWRKDYSTPLDQALQEAAPDLYQERRMGTNPALQSVSAFLTYLTLAAHALGYGSCWLTSPMIARKELEEYLTPMKGMKLVAMVAIGRAPSGKAAPPRRSFEETARFYSQ